MVTKFFDYYISKGDSYVGGVYAQCVCLSVGCVGLWVCMGAGVLVVAQWGLWGGLCWV